MVAICRSLFGMLVAHYTDDTWGLEPAAFCKTATTIWWDIHKVIGWRLDSEKTEGPIGRGRLLGAEL